MKFKKIGMLALSATFMFALASCNKKNNNNQTENSITQKITTSTNNVNSDDKYRIYLLAQTSGYEGTYEEWLESIKGDAITIMVIDGKLKWKYSTERDSEYRTLLDLSTLKGEDGKGIVSIARTAQDGLIDTYTITFSDNTTYNFTVTNGEAGSSTSNKGIKSISKTGQSGLIDTYTITFTDDTYETFTVTNGESGTSGRGIVSVLKTGSNGLVDTYTITYSDQTYDTFTITNGEPGTAGKGIVSIEKGESSGLVDTYIITFTDNSTYEFTVTNGENGSGNQTQNDVIESYEWIDGDLFKSIVSIDGTKIEVIKQVFKGSWINRVKYIKDYDENGELILNESYEWNSVNSEWQTNSIQKVTTEWDANTRVSSKWIRESSDSDWLEYERTTTIFTNFNSTTDEYEDYIEEITLRRNHEDINELKIACQNDVWDYKNRKENNDDFIRDLNYKNIGGNWILCGDFYQYDKFYKTELFATYTWNDDINEYTEEKYVAKTKIYDNDKLKYDVELRYHMSEGEYVADDSIEKYYNDDGTYYERKNEGLNSAHGEYEGYFWVIRNTRYEKLGENEERYIEKVYGYSREYNVFYVVKESVTDDIVYYRYTSPLGGSFGCMQKTGGNSSSDWNFIDKTYNDMRIFTCVYDDNGKITKFLEKDANNEEKVYEETVIVYKDNGLPEWEVTRSWDATLNDLVNVSAIMHTFDESDRYTGMIFYAYDSETDSYKYNAKFAYEYDENGEFSTQFYTWSDELGWVTM